MIDIGSSTGGFTDCALQNGANMSYAVDVGYNQLAWKLRQDERVIVMERTNFRYVTPADLIGKCQNLQRIDVSFISLTLILPVLKTLLVQIVMLSRLSNLNLKQEKSKLEKKGLYVMQKFMKK